MLTSKVNIEWKPICNRFPTSPSFKDKSSRTEAEHTGNLKPGNPLGKPSGFSSLKEFAWPPNGLARTRLLLTSYFLRMKKSDVLRELLLGPESKDSMYRVYNLRPARHVARWFTQTQPPNPHGVVGYLPRFLGKGKIIRLPSCRVSLAEKKEK